MRLKLPSCRLAACTAAATLPLCSHGLSLRQSQALQALLIIAAIYGNPLSSQHGVTSLELMSYTSDDTLSLRIQAIIILLQGWEGWVGDDEFSLRPPP